MYTRVGGLPEPPSTIFRDAVGPLVTGVAVVLLFSIAWPIPIRSVNGLLCLGVVLGGFVAGTMQARANGNMLEPSRGLKLGGRVGLTAAAIVILVDLLFEYADFGQGARAGVDVLDPIPKYIYAAIYGIWDGLLDLVARNEGEGLEWPGRIARYVILLGSTYLFGGFGGGVAASTVESPRIEDLPESRPETPVIGGWMRQAPAIVQLQRPQEAQIFQPPPQARPAAARQAPARAATGTYGPADPRWVNAAQQASGLAALPPSGGSYSTPQGQPQASTEQPKPEWMPDTRFSSQPFFDEAAQTQGRRRPHDTVSLERDAAGRPANPVSAPESAQQ